MTHPRWGGRRSDWLPPTQTRTPGARTLEDVLLDLEKGVQRLGDEVAELKQALEKLEEAVRESGGSVADPGS